MLRMRQVTKRGPLAVPTRLMVVCACLALLLAGGIDPAHAGDDDKPAKKKKRDGFDFGGRPAKPEAARPGAKPAEIDVEQDPVKAEVARLARWPSRAADLAAEALYLRGDEAVPYLVLALKQGDASIQPGAATVLGRIGQEVHVQVILRAAAKRPNGHRAEDFFRAAYNLSPKATKRWLIGFLPLSDRPIFRGLAAKFLATKVNEEDRDRVLNLLESRKAAVRAAGLQLLKPARVDDADARLLQALSDIHHSVAKKSALLLALEMGPSTREQLNALAREGDSRERAYATLALIEAMRTSGEQAFEPATIAEVSGRRGLLHPDKLSRTSAAIGLAFGAMDTRDQAISSLLDSTVVDVLVEAVGGDHFRDYESFRDPVFAALRRLSGRVDIPDNAVAWARWWMTSKSSFRARRPLRSITPSDLPNAYVRFTMIGADGGRSWAEFIASDGRPRKGAFLLTPDAFRALVGALDHAGIFDAEERVAARADEHVKVVLGVADQHKTLVLAPGARDMRYVQVKMRFTSLLDANVWQRYRDTDRSSSAREWWQQNREKMAEVSPEERTALLKKAVVNAFDDLSDDEAREEAYHRLEDLGARLTESEQRTFAKALTGGTAFGDFEARALRWTIAQAGPAVRSELIEAVAARLEPAAQIILSDLIREGGLARVEDAFGDPRPGMRAAACRAARDILARPERSNLTPAELENIGDRLRPGLEVMAVDDEPSVAVQGVLGLAYLGEAGVVSRLETLYKGGNLGTKLEVADALGRLPSEEGHGLLTYILAEERIDGAARLRATALESLARSGHPNAVRILSFYLLNDKDGAVRRAAGDALVELGTRDARLAVIEPLMAKTVMGSKKAQLLEVLAGFEGEIVASLLQRHLTDKDTDVVAAAALGAAHQNLDSAVPALIHLLRKGSGTQKEKALRAIETLTSRRLPASGYANAAEQYEQWYETNSGGGFRRWFRDSLKDRAYDVGPLNGWMQGRPDKNSIPLLVRVLRDPDPVLRRNAAVALRETAGQSLGEVERTTSARDAAAIADLWSRWWSSQNPGR